MNTAIFSPDMQDFIKLLSDHAVRYVIVGGHAVIYYGHVRLTGDIDIFYDRSEENSERLYAALAQFWDGNIPGVASVANLRVPGQVIQFGLPPNRIDLINTIEGVGFDEAWEHRTSETGTIRGETCAVNLLGLKQLLKNKNALQRNKDLDDIKFLSRLINQ